MKIGILTSGGDCPGLNAVIRGFAKYVFNNIKDAELIGISEGYLGLIEKDAKKMSPSDFSGILNVGGTIKTLEGERLDKFMDELGKLSVKKDDDGYPDASYDYCLRIYIEGKDGYLRYYLGQELTKVNIKSGAKESFYYFNDYDAARDLVAKYFYER